MAEEARLPTPLDRPYVNWGLTGLSWAFYASLRGAREHNHFSRIPIAIIIGVGMGLSVRRVLLASIIAQLRATMVNFQGLDALGIVKNIIIIVRMIASIAYFVMSEEQTGTYGSIAGNGSLYLMATFGAMFGSSLTYWLALDAGQVRYILKSFGLL